MSFLAFGCWLGSGARVVLGRRGPGRLAGLVDVDVEAGVGVDVAGEDDSIGGDEVGGGMASALSCVLLGTSAGDTHRGHFFAPSESSSTSTTSLLTNNKAD